MERRKELARDCDRGMCVAGEPGAHAAGDEPSLGEKGAL